VGLVAAELERQGISTVAIQLLRKVTEQVRPPRALTVPFRHGYPLGIPDDAEHQQAVIAAALRMLENPNLQPPAIVDYMPE
jgi:D-proline reductase (dithiol) PrdB